MSNFTPLWEKIVESSVWEESDLVVKVFITLLAKQDRDHVVRGSAYNIAKWANKTEIEVLEALKVLSEPDKRRLEPQEHEGRRIQKVEDGWLLLNGEKYQRLMLESFRRARNALAMSERRARQRAQMASSGTQAERNFVAGKTDDQAIADEVRESKEARHGQQIAAEQEEPDPVYPEPPDDSGEVKA